MIAKNKPSFLTHLPDRLIQEVDEGRAAVAGGAVRAEFDGTPLNDIDVYIFSQENYVRLVEELGAVEVPGTNGYAFALLDAPGKPTIEIVYTTKRTSMETCIKYADFDIASGTYCAGQFGWDPGFPEAIKTKIMRFFREGTASPEGSYRRYVRYIRQYGYAIDASIQDLVEMCPADRVRQPAHPTEVQMSEKKGMLFVLGGDDLEMVVIRWLLGFLGVRWVQPRKGWGNHVLTPGECVVEAGDFSSVIFVECAPGEGWDPATTTIADHHGDLSWRESSLMQVIDRLNARDKMSERLISWAEVVSANDMGHIAGMKAMGATQAEITHVRFLDREAQGITPEQEAGAERAVAEKETDGRLTVVRLAHSKTATVCDRLHRGAGGSGYDQLVILSGDGEANFYGDGALCVVLKEKFQGWNGGGGLGHKGMEAYWGGYPNHDELLAFVREQLS